MMQGGDRTPTLEEAGLPEFRGATLYLASKSAQETDDDDKDVFVDIVDLSRHSDKDDEPKESQSESRRRSTYPQLQSPAESGNSQPEFRNWFRYYLKQSHPISLSIFRKASNMFESPLHQIGI